MLLESLPRAVGTSHPAARDPEPRTKPRLLLLAGGPIVSPMSGRPIDEVDGSQDPVIETERLVLRPLAMTDFPAYFAMLADPGCFTYSQRTEGMTSDEAWTRFLRQAGHWNVLGYGPFAVIEKATGCFVGEVGFGDFRRGLGGDFDYCPEASWTVVSDMRGQGIATEAIKAAVEWMEEIRGTGRTVCIIHSRNRPSLRIARKRGFKPFRYTEYRGYPAIFHKREKPMAAQRF